MRQKAPSAAGLISVVLAVVLVVATYAVLGTVDVVFMHEGRQLERINDVNMISEITLPEGEFTYVVDGETKTLQNADDLKTHISITLLNNLINLKWSDYDHIITVTQE